MNLISCEECGVVIDVGRLYFPHDIYKDDGTIGDDLAVWDGEDYVAYLPCPVCNSPVTK